jgi:Zn finger protein HypA/HybF involved in hydrogenase expression
MNTTLTLVCDRCNHPYTADHITGVCGQCGEYRYQEPRVLTDAEIRVAADIVHNRHQEN